MSHNARSSDVFNTRYSLIIKMHHNKYHWMRMVQAIIQRLQIELAIGELVPFQNHAGLRGWIQTGRPYPTFHGILKPSTCGFDFTDCGMLGGSRPGPVNRHGFEIVGCAGGAVGPDNGPGAGGTAVGRMADRAADARNGGPRDSGCPKGAGEEGGGNAAARVRGPSRILTPAAESFSEIVLASPPEFPYSTSSHGGVAQLGERLTGSQEVRGSIPLVSTRALNKAPTQVGAFFHIGTQGQRRHHDPPGRQDRKKLRRTRPL